MITELKYMFFTGIYDFDKDKNIFVGKIKDIDESFTFKGENKEKIKKAFEDAVDNYILLCKALGKDPYMYKEKERKIKKIPIKRGIDWSGVSFEKIKKDIDELEKIGANHIEIQNYYEDIIKVEAYQVREETEEEYQERLKELKKEEEKIREKELKLLKMLQEKYQTNQQKCKCHKTVQEQLKELENDYTNRLNEIVGKWPSDEKFEDLMKMLDEDNK